MGIVWKIVPSELPCRRNPPLVFTLHGLSEYQGEMRETLVCKNTANGAKEITGEVMMIIHASASVTVPSSTFRRTPWASTTARPGPSRCRCRRVR